VLGVYEDMDVTDVIRSRGRHLLTALEQIAERLRDYGVSAKGIPEMCYLDFQDSNLSAEFASRAAGRSVIFKRNAYNFVSYAHSDEILGEIVARLEEVAEEVKRTC
jgi:hypothetical protein